jgi:hypothetical protein
VKERLNAFVRALGPLGVVGIGVLLACGGFYLSGFLPVIEAVHEQRLAIERMRAPAAYRPVSSSGPADDLARFYGFFPPAGELTRHVDRLHRLALRSDLELAQAEYRLEKPRAGLWTYRITLPVRGSYAQVRDFVGAVLLELPVASLDALRFERKRALDADVDAQLGLTLYLRPSGDSP